MPEPIAGIFTSIIGAIKLSGLKFSGAPFVMATGTAPKWNLTRILEALIIAGLSGGIVMYGVQQVLVVQMAYIREDMAKAELRHERQRQEDLARLDKADAEHLVREDRIETKIDNHIQRGRQ